MVSDLGALVISFVYVGAVVAVSEGLSRWKGLGTEFTRRFTHIAVGLWIIPTLFLFRTWYWAAIPPAAAVVVNFASLRTRLMQSIERTAKHDYGTVLFPLSFVICITAFFSGEHRAAAAAGIVIMALGDAAAGIIGRKFGRHPYTFLGAKKSVEGSAAMLVVSVPAAWVTLAIFGVPAVTAAITALVIAAVGTVLEAAGKYGLDNFTVPVACSGLAYLLLAGLTGSGG